MGNILSETNLLDDLDPPKADLQWIATQNTMMFNEDFLSEAFSKLPPFSGTEEPEKEEEKIEASAQTKLSGEDEKAIQKLIDLIVPVKVKATAVADFKDLLGNGEGITKTPYGHTLRMRLRLMLRLHLAMLRQSGVRMLDAEEDTKGGGAKKAAADIFRTATKDDAAAADPDALLNTLVQSTLTLAAQLRGADPALFSKLCQNLVVSLVSAPALSLQKVVPGSPKWGMVEAIHSFTTETLSDANASDAEKGNAISLLFALGMARGSVADLIAVCNALVANNQTLPFDGGGFLDELQTRFLEHTTPLQLSLPTEATMIEGFTLRSDEDGQEGCGKGYSRPTSIAADGPHLYVLTERRAGYTVRKVGSGRRGSVAGAVLVKQDNLLAQLAEKLGRTAPEGDRKGRWQLVAAAECLYVHDSALLSGQELAEIDPETLELKGIVSLPPSEENEQLAEIDPETLEPKGIAHRGPEGAVYFVLKSGRYQGQTLYANENSRSYRLAVATVGESSNTSVSRRYWIFSLESGLITLFAEGDDKITHVKDNNYLYANGTASPDSLAVWTLSDNGVFSLADGRQLYVDHEKWIQVALPGEAGNTDPTMREWEWFSREEYEQRSARRQAHRGPEGTVHFVLKSGRYQGQTLYATNRRSRCLAAGDCSNTSVTRREWVFSRESGLITLIGEGDDKITHVKDNNYLYANGTASPDSLRAWTLSDNGVFSLADGRQLYVDHERWIQVALPGEAGNTDPTMREWEWFSREEYEQRSARRQAVSAVLPERLFATEGRHLVVVTPKLCSLHDPLDGMAKVAVKRAALGAVEDLGGCQALTNGSRLNVLTVPPCDKENHDPWARTSSCLLDLDRPDEDAEQCWEKFEKTRGFPQAYAYDASTNLVFGWNPVHQQVCCWRNKGLAPSFEPPRPPAHELIHSQAPGHRFEALCALEASPRVAAAKVLCQLDRLASPYQAKGDETQDQDQYKVSVISIGREFKGDIKPEMALRGVNMARQDENIFNLCSLTDDMQISQVKNYNYNDGHVPLMLDWIEGLPKGTYVLVQTNKCSFEDPNQNELFTQGMVSLGYDYSPGNQDKTKQLTAGDCFGLIGRKGSKPGTAAAKLVKSGQKCLLALSQYLPLRALPLAIEVTPDTMNGLVDLVLLRGKELTGQAPLGDVDKSLLLSTMRLLGAHLHQLRLAVNWEDQASYFDAAKLKAFKELMLEVIDHPPTGETMAALADEAVHLFTSAMGVLYPSFEERCILLGDYLHQYTTGDLSEFEARVLALLLRRLSDAESVLHLMQQLAESGSSRESGPAQLLFANLLDFVTDVTCKSLQSANVSQIRTRLQKKRLSVPPPRPTQNVGKAPSGIIQTSERMMTALLNQMLSQICHRLQPSEEKLEGEAAAKKANEVDEAYAALNSIVDAISTRAARMLDIGLQVSGSSAGIDPKISKILSDSPLRSLMPTVAAVVMYLANNSKVLDPSRVFTLGGLLVPVQRALAHMISKLPSDLKVKKTAGGEPKAYTVQVVMESLHEYQNNMHEIKKLCIPKAKTMVIEFDSQCKTENGYDYVQFFKDEACTQKMHRQEKFHGRGGSQNWPGCEGREPLVLEGDTAHVLFHTDSSNTDWGWKFTATARVGGTGGGGGGGPQPGHWLVELERTVTAFAAYLAGFLLVGTEWGGAKEEEYENWLNDDLLQQDLEQDDVTDADREFLISVGERSPGSLGEIFCKQMRRAVLEDKGQVEAVNRAVYYTCAALIKQNGLVHDAVALAEGKRDKPSQGLKKAWRAGQKMRHFFRFGDLGLAVDTSAPPTPMLERGPSSFPGSDEQAVDEISRRVIQKALFVLSLKKAQHATADGQAKKRWNLLSAFAKSSRETKSFEGIDKLVAVVQQVVAADDLKHIFAFRRRTAHRFKKQLTTSEKVLKFCQSFVDSNELASMVSSRDERAQLRAKGLTLMANLVEHTGCEISLSLALSLFSHYVRLSPKEDSVGWAHYLVNVLGCSFSARQALTEQYQHFLTAATRRLSGLVTTLNAEIPAEGKDPTPASIAAIDAIGKCLEAIALDYTLADHHLLEQSGLAGALEPLLTHPHQEVRGRVWALLELLLVRCVGLQGQACDQLAVEGLSGFSQKLVTILTKQLEASTNGLREYLALQGTDHAWRPESVEGGAVFLAGIAEVSPLHAGRVAPHLALGGRSSVSLWFCRAPGDEALLARKKFELGDKVCCGPGTRESTDEVFWINRVGEVTKVTDEKVEVKWDTSTASCSYDLPKADDEKCPISLVDPNMGGVLFSKGALRSLSEEEAEQPWGQYGLFLRGDATVGFEASQGGGSKLPFTVHGKTPLEARKWVHLAIVLAGDRVKLYVDGELDGSARIPPAMALATPGAQTIESEHPSPEPEVLDEGKALNRLPFYLGQAPSYAAEAPAAAGQLAHCVVYGRALTRDQLQALFSEEGARPEGALPANAESRVVEVLALVLKTAAEMTPSSMERFVQPDVLEGVLLVLLKGPPKAAAAAAAVAQKVLPFATMASVNNQLARMSGSASPSLIETLLSLTGAELCPWSDRLPSVGSEDALSVADAYVGLVRELVGNSSEWGEALVGASERLLNNFQLNQADTSTVQTIAGILATCGGNFEALRVGSSALLDAGDGALPEECTVVGFTSPPTTFDGKDKKTKEKLWKDCKWGDAVAVSVHSDPGSHRVVAQSQLAARTPAFPPSFRDFLVTATARLEPLLTPLLQLPTSDPSAPVYGPKLEREETTLEFEYDSPKHADMYTEVEVEGAEELEVTFSRTEEASRDPDPDGAVYFVLKSGKYQGQTLYANTKNRQLAVWPNGSKSNTSVQRREWVFSRESGLITLIGDGNDRNVYVKDNNFLHADGTTGPDSLRVWTLSADGVFSLADGRQLYLDLQRLWQGERKWIQVALPGEGGNTDPTMREWELISREEYEQRKRRQGCDLVRFCHVGSTSEFYSYSNGSVSDVTTFSGRGNSENLPGTGDCPPLKIPAGAFRIYFHNDGSNTELGYKICVKGVKVKTIQPPELPPSETQMAACFLRAQTVRVVSSLLEASDKFLALMTHLAPDLLKTSLAEFGSSSSSGGRSKTQIFESNHPYINSMDRKEDISIPGASKLIIEFDDQTRTESEYDYIIFFADKDHQTMLHQEKYSGGKSGSRSNWPGIGGRPPLEIEGDSCHFWWHTDSSVNDWGWIFTVTPEYAGGGSRASSTAEAAFQLASLGALLRDGPASQTIPPPEALNGFPIKKEQAKGLAEVRAALEAAGGAEEEKGETSEEETKKIDGVEVDMPHLFGKAGGKDKAEFKYVKNDGKPSSEYLNPEKSQAVEDHMALFGLSAPSIQKGQVFRLLAAFSDAANQAAVLYARAAIVQFLAHWPKGADFNVAFLGSPEEIILLMKTMYEKKEISICKQLLDHLEKRIVQFIHHDSTEGRAFASALVRFSLNNLKSTKGVLGQAEKLEEDTPVRNLSKWILQLISKEKVPVVREALFCPSALSILLSAFKSSPDEVVMRSVCILFASMFKDISDVDTNPEVLGMLHKIANAVKSRCNEEIRKSDKSEGLIQTLLHSGITLFNALDSITPSSDDVDKKKAKAQTCALTFNPECIGHTLETKDSRKTVTAIADSSSLDKRGMAISEQGFQGKGKHVWALKATTTSPGDAVGIVKADEQLDVNRGTHDQQPGSFFWEFTGSIVATGQGENPPPEPHYGQDIELQSGDRVDLELDLGAGTIAFSRNKVQLGLAVGPIGSGAALEVNNPFSEGAVYHVAVILQAEGNSFSFFQGGETEDAEVFLPQAKQIDPFKEPTSSSDPMAQFQSSVNYLEAISQRSLPQAIISKHFASKIMEDFATIMSQSYEEGEEFEREVRVPGAAALRLRFGAGTRMGPEDTLRLTGGPGRPPLEFRGVDGARLNYGSAREGGLQVGDRVVRGPAWDEGARGARDGARGGVGVVVAAHRSPEGTVHFVLKSGRYQGKTLYANQRSRCLALGDCSSVTRREWVFSRESGLITLIGEGDDKITHVKDNNYLYANGTASPDSLRVWTLSYNGVFSLADGRQLYVDNERWIQVALPGEAGNTDPTMREWEWFSREEYEQRSARRQEGGCYADVRWLETGETETGYRYGAEGGMFELQLLEPAKLSRDIIIKGDCASVCMVPSGGGGSGGGGGGGDAKKSSLLQPEGAAKHAERNVALQIEPVFDIDTLTGKRIDEGPLAEKFNMFMQTFNAGSEAHDLALVSYVNAQAKKKGYGLDQMLSIKWSELTPSQEDLVRNPKLNELVQMGKATEEGDGKAKESWPSPVEARFDTLQGLNTVFRHLFAYVDFGLFDKPWSLAAMFLRCKGLLFEVSKREKWENAMQRTKGNGGHFDLKLSRSRAKKHASNGGVDHEGRHSVFGQAFRQMHPMPTAVLRRADKLYTCVLMGERSQDAGGPYRESWSMYAQELMSENVPMLLRSPNGRHAIGYNRDKFMPHPGSTSTTHLEMFVFLGKLLGMAIRTKEYLAVNIAPACWKLLAGELLSPGDLEEIDHMVIQSLNSLRDIEKQGVDETSFEDVIFETFTTMSSDDREVELKLNGADIAVTFQNRHEYCNMVLRYRLHEFDKQVAAMRQGLGMMVPLRLLSLFTPGEVEALVCGSPELDLALFKQATEYSGVSESDQHVLFFWEALESFSNEEREMFLRFTWGRSRLPMTLNDFPQRFKIQSFNSSPADQYYPVAHTCFFSLELPRYSTLDIMKEKIRYAIFGQRKGHRSADIRW